MMSMLINGVEKIDLPSIFSRNFIRRPIILGTFGDDVHRTLINTTIVRSLDWKSVVIIDSTGHYLPFQKFFENSIPLVLGYNFSIPLFDLNPNDPYLSANDLSETFRISFHISDQAARALQYALVSMINRGIYDPSIEDVILEIESQVQFSSTKFNAHRLLRLLDLLTWGRVGAAFSGREGFMDVEDKVVFIDLHLLPREFRVFASFKILLNLIDRDVSIIVEDADLMLPGLVRALREEYALAFERTFFTLDLINRSKWRNLVLSCISPSFISPRIRIKFDYVFSSIPKSREELDSLFNYFPYSRLNVKFIGSFSSNCFLIFYDGRVKMGGLLFKSIPDFKVEVEETVKPIKPRMKSLLQKFFKNFSEAAFQILSFLSQGSIDRDSLISYAVGLLGLESKVAQRIINSLSVYGLIIEFMGRDGRCYFKITPSGIAALNEYISFWGG